MLENNQKEIILLEDLGMQFATETSKYKFRYGLYKCFCGNEFKTLIQSVKNKNTSSCGCYQKQRARDTKITHNLAYHRLYGTWQLMIDRCNNPKSKIYKHYGERGISVCNEWLDIRNFINDMNPTYQEGLALDRIDNNKGYSIDNCRWAKQNVQHRNTRLLISTNTSGYRGVSWVKSRNKWRARIAVDCKVIHLGYFNTALDGAKAYDNYIIINKLEHTRNFS